MTGLVRYVCLCCNGISSKSFIFHLIENEIVHFLDLWFGSSNLISSKQEVFNKKSYPLKTLGSWKTITRNRFLSTGRSIRTGKMFVNQEILFSIRLEVFFKVLSFSCIQSYIIHLLWFVLLSILLMAQYTVCKIMSYC